MNKIDSETGLRNADRISKMVVKWKNNTIIDGLNMHQVIAKKSGLTRKTNIDPVTGLTPTKVSARKRIKYLQTTINPETGKSLFDLAVEKRMEHDNNLIDPETGLNGHQLKAKHATETKRKRIDPITGLSVLDIQIDRLLKSSVYCGIKMYKNTKIHYQGSYEFKWLEKMEQLYGTKFLDKITQPRISYYDSTTGKIRMYYTDFVIENIVYEIKSSWTWNKELERNKDKIKACLNEGYKVKIIINHEEYDGKDLI
jgi:translation initiation factor 1 (eIF-1/SUI1)